jgi:hypothetical protein
MALCSDPHHRHHAVGDSGGDQIRRGKTFPFAVVVDWGVGD